MAQYLLIERLEGHRGLHISVNSRRIGHISNAGVFAPTVIRTASGERTLDILELISPRALSLALELTSEFQPHAAGYASCLVNLDTEQVYINGRPSALTPPPVEERLGEPKILKSYASLLHYLSECERAREQEAPELTELLLTYCRELRSLTTNPPPALVELEQQIQRHGVRL